MKASGEAAEVADGERGNIAGRFKVMVGPHIETCRPDIGCYVGLVGLSGAMLASGRWTVWHLAAAFLIPALVSTAAYYGGAYFDREIDAVGKPDRPVPSGLMNARSALVGMVVSIAAGLVLAAVLNPVNLAFVLVVVMVVAGYGRFRGARRPIRVFTRGMTTVAVFGIAAVTTSGSPLWDLVMLGLVFWQQDSMIHQVLAIDDAGIDRHTGISTIPVRYGDKVALSVLLVTLVFWVSSAAFQPASVISRTFDVAAYAPFVVIATVLAIAATVTLFRASRPIAGRPVTRAYDILAIERPCVAAGFVAAAGAVVLALVLLVLSTALTLLTRRAHRRQRRATQSFTT